MNAIDYSKAPDCTGLDPVRWQLTMSAWMNEAHGFGLNPQQWLLDNAREFPRGPLPKRVRRGVIRQCYHNALELASRGRGRYVYMEGMAVGVIPVDHAWCYDRETGLVVDRTWERDHGQHYLGVPVRLAYVKKQLSRGHVVVNDWENDYPLVTGAVTPDVWREEL